MTKLMQNTLPVLAAKVDVVGLMVVVEGYHKGVVALCHVYSMAVGVVRASIC